MWVKPTRFQLVLRPMLLRTEAVANRSQQTIVYLLSANSNMPTDED